MAKYLSHSQHNGLCLAGSALGIAMLLYGAHDLNTPDFPVTDKVVDSIYQSGQQWAAAPPVVEDVRYRLRGLATGVLGLGVLAASVMGASSEPFKTMPEQTRDIETDQPILLTTSSPQRLKNTFTNRLKVMLDQSSELRQLLRAPVVIVVGGQGSGKTTFCGVLGLMRALLEGDEIANLDPHYSKNQAMGYVPWITGDIYESPQDIKAQVMASLETRQGSQPFRSTFFDEFSNWKASHGLADECINLTAAATQDVRKSRQRFIFIAHGLEKEMLCPDADTGRHSSLLTQAVVVRLGSKTNDYGEFEPAGWMEFKPSGKALKPGKVGDRVALPELFLPPNDRGRRGINADIEAMLEMWGLTARDSDQRWNPISPEIEEYVSRINPHNPEVREILERAVQSTTTHVDPSENVHNGTMEWTDHPQSILIVKLLKYCFSKQQQLIEDNGGIAIRKLAKNWGRNNDLTTEQLKDLLDVAVFYNVGCWVGDDLAHWRPTISPDSLPEEGDI